jgi:hypothetical protein
MPNQLGIAGKSIQTISTDGQRTLITNVGRMVVQSTLLDSVASEGAESSRAVEERKSIVKLNKKFETFNNSGYYSN